MAGQRHLGDSAREREHGQAAILQFGELVPLRCFWRLHKKSTVRESSGTADLVKIDSLSMGAGIRARVARDILEVSHTGRSLKKRRREVKQVVDLSERMNTQSPACGSRV